jgi:hypothetical protein
MEIDFRKNLVFLYHVIVASESLLIQAARRAKSGALADFFTRHLREERDHDRWLEEDLLSLGIVAKRTAVPIEAVEMVGFVYYFVMHVDACCLLGYMLLLEGTPWSIERIEQYEARFGKAALRTLRHHAEHDPAHAKAVRATIETLTPMQKRLVAQTFKQCLKYLGRAVEAMQILEEKPCLSH